MIHDQNSTRFLNLKNSTIKLHLKKIYCNLLSLTEYITFLKGMITCVSVSDLEIREGHWELPNI